MGESGESVGVLGMKLSDPMQRDLMRPVSAEVVAQRPDKKETCVTVPGTLSGKNEKIV